MAGHDGTEWATHRAARGVRVRQHTAAGRACEVWTGVLRRLLVPAAHEYLHNLYADAEAVARAGRRPRDAGHVWAVFQRFCRETVSWSRDELGRRTDAVRARCAYLDDLVDATLDANARVLGASRTAGVVRTAPPAGPGLTADLVHECFVCAAQAAFRYPFLFARAAASTRERMANHMAAEALVGDAFEEALASRLPLAELSAAPSAADAHIATHDDGDGMRPSRSHRRQPRGGGGTEPDRAPSRAVRPTADDVDERHAGYAQHGTDNDALRDRPQRHPYEPPPQPHPQPQWSPPPPASSPTREQRPRTAATSEERDGHVAAAQTHRDDRPRATARPIWDKPIDAVPDATDENVVPTDEARPQGSRPAGTLAADSPAAAAYVVERPAAAAAAAATAEVEEAQDVSAPRDQGQNLNRAQPTSSQDGGSGGAEAGTPFAMLSRYTEPTVMSMRASLADALTARSPATRADTTGTMPAPGTATDGSDRSADRGPKRSAADGYERSAADGYERSADRCTERSADRGTERNTDRGSECSTDRSTERSADRGAERNTERGSERSTDRGAERSADRGAERTTERGSVRSTERGSERSIDRGTERSTDRSTERSTGRGTERSADRGTERGAMRDGRRTQAESMGAQQGYGATPRITSWWDTPAPGTPTRSWLAPDDGRVRGTPSV